jgi:hypothetical protein
MRAVTLSMTETGMNERERDQALLSCLHADDRATLESLAEEFIRAELAAPTPENLRHAADMFEAVGGDRPPSEGLTGFIMAALLRERAATALRH